MPGIEAAGARAHRDQKRVVRVAEARTSDPLDMREARLDLGVEARRQRSPCVVVAVAERRRDGEAGRDGQTDSGHLGEVGALAAEQRTHPGIAVRRTAAEAVDPAAHGSVLCPERTYRQSHPSIVMAGLVPAIHEDARPRPARRDARIPGTSPGMSGHDEKGDAGISHVCFRATALALDLGEVGDAIQRAADLREHQQPVAAKRRVVTVDRDMVEEGVHRSAQRCH